MAFNIHSLCKISTALLEAKATQEPQERSEAEIQILNFCNFHGSKISKLQELEWVVDQNQEFPFLSV